MSTRNSLHIEQSVSLTPLRTPDLETALAIRDLADPAAGLHAVQLVVGALEHAIAAGLGVRVRRVYGERLVSVADNYDRLRYSPDDVTRSSRYSRYAGGGMMLRSHTTAQVPAQLTKLANAPEQVLLSLPGICYRRDVIDRQHVGEPHQIDLWVIRPTGPALTEVDLAAMVELAVTAVLPGRTWQTPPSPHPYTLAGREVYVSRPDGVPVEIGECGMAHPEVLRGAGLGPLASGLAMGLGLDRLVMLVKGVPDIRLLRSADPRIAGQMADLRPYLPVSMLPPVRRDLSLAMTDADPELLGDRIRRALGPGATAIETAQILASTGYDGLPPAARTRLGIRPGQENVLLRLVLRDHSRTLTDADANAIRDQVYAVLHEGSAGDWTAPGPSDQGWSDNLVACNQPR